jgi:type IV pilus assembly protein PilZ
MSQDITQVLEYSLNNISELYRAYMPFLQNGGLFVRTKQVLSLGERVQLSFCLMKDQERYTIDTKVAWITPRGAQGNKPEGMGLQFLGDNSHLIRDKIEAYLGERLQSTEPTDTM